VLTRVGGALINRLPTPRPLAPLAEKRNAKKGVDGGNEVE
jgi:hypothetical protein